MNKFNDSLSPVLLVKFMSKVLLKYDNDWLVFLNKKNKISHYVSVNIYKNPKIYFKKSIMIDSKKIILLHKYKNNLYSFLPTLSQNIFFSKLLDNAIKHNIKVLDQVISDGYGYWSRLESRFIMTV